MLVEGPKVVKILPFQKGFSHVVYALDLKFASTFFVDDKLAFQIDTSYQYR